MATLLEYGHQPAQPMVMSSFIDIDEVKHDQPGTSGAHQNMMVDDIDGPNNRTCEPQSYNLDGTHNRSKDNPFTRSKTIKTESHQTPAPVGTYVQSAAQTSPPGVGVQHVHKTISFDATLLPNPPKRRKLSPADNGSDSRAINRSEPVDLNVGAQKYNAQCTASVQESDYHLHGIGKAGQTLGMTTENPLDSIAETRMKRDSRKKQARNQTSPGEIQEQVSSTESVSPTTASKINKRLPRKKTLSLHINGKLTSLPTADLDSALSDNAHGADSRNAASKRNYKMRNGKFVQTMEVVIRYGRDQTNRCEIGQRIDAVLSQSKGGLQSDTKGVSSMTHPFFLGKVKSRTQGNKSGQMPEDGTDNESSTHKQEPVAWADIKFSSLKPTIFKSLESIPPAWPPLPLQHVGHELPTSETYRTEASERNKVKLKSRLVQLQKDESVLQEYLRNMKKALPISDAVETPQRRYFSGAKVAADLQSVSATPCTHDAISSIRSVIVNGSTAFDRGQYAGPNMWTSQYAPQRWSEVLQPSASILHRWLQGLAIHNVKSGVDTNGTLRKLKGPARKTRRKLKNKLDDFVVSSDDDDEAEKSSKTAILITGPNGCGKTASVFAIARELGFEVFEIHPGMRRTAKDIFDKVGDMAHNHLVQKGADLSRSPSVALSGADTDTDTDVDIKQPSIAGLFKAKHGVNLLTTDTSKLTPRGKKEQKQSLILFEEVDQLFEDDKGFWGGVQSLIKHSKRPVILTCNEPSSVPVEDLDLYGTLTYESVDQELAADYLVHLAAAEGHILDRGAVSTLYTLKQHDLRASITELNLWCQMTVGSKQGGLDWMLQGSSGQPKVDQDGKKLRIFSQGTFQKSLDLMPQASTDDADAIGFAQDYLGVAASSWCDFEGREAVFNVDDCGSNLQVLSRLASITEARSMIDILDDTAAPALALALATACLNHKSKLTSNRDLVTRYYVNETRDVHCETKAMMNALVPIMTEKPTFPPSLGRLAPSIDAYTSIVSTEIAPYVRGIVRFDQRLEQQRDEIFGSQGKFRKTRAARAAAEGGDKASTRSERWFPNDLDFDKVIQTGGAWPQWHEDERKSKESVTTSPSPSTGASA